MRDRFLFITQQLIGFEVEVERTDGVWLTGVFHTAHTTTQHNFSIIVKMVRVKGKGEAAAKEAGITPGQTLVLEAREFRQVFCPSMEIGTNRAVEARTGLMTDSAISGKQKEGLYGRDLTKWEADGADATGDLEMTDEDGTWDQFEANKRLFNIDSTFNEDLYTTKLDYHLTDAALQAKAERVVSCSSAEQPLRLPTPITTIPPSLSSSPSPSLTNPHHNNPSLLIILTVTFFQPSVLGPSVPPSFSSLTDPFPPSPDGGRCVLPDD